MKSITHFRDLLFRQLGPRDSILSIHRDRDEVPERWRRLESEFREVVELPESKLVE